MTDRRETVLFVCNGYPSDRRPWKCPFNARAVSAVGQGGPVKAMSVRGWAPFRAAKSYVYGGIEVRELMVPHCDWLLWGPSSGPIGHMRHGLWQRTLRRVAKQIIHVAGGVGVIHSVGLGPHAFAAQMVADQIGCAHFVQLIGNDVTLLSATRAATPVFRRWHERVTGFVANSASLQELFVAVAGSAPPVTVLYRGVDLRRFSPHEVPAADGARAGVRCVYLGGNVGTMWQSPGADGKGADVLLKAWQAVEHATRGAARLLVGGPHICPIGFRRFRRTLRFPDRVTCVGAVPSDQIPGLLRSADLLLIPSRREGLPNVCLEAMACAVPVLASNAGGVAEVIRPGIDGVLVAVEDASAFAEAAVQLIHDETTRRRLGRAARTRAEMCFDASSYGTKLRAVYGSSGRSFAAGVMH